MVAIGKLDESNYLIKDGSLDYQRVSTKKNKHALNLSNEHIRNNYRRVIGVSKSFDPTKCFVHGGGTNSNIIAELELYERTPAFRYTSTRANVDFCIWYLRIRDARYTHSIFDGILKIEKLIVTEKEQVHGIETDDINNITAYLINERNPVCYGADDRWANHLYPVYLTEQYVKSKYLSNDLFIQLFYGGGNMSLIGRVIATEKVPTTIDNSCFWTNVDLILNPFDVVKVEHIHGSKTFAVIEEISHITDSASFLSNFISNDFGDVNTDAPTLRIGMNFAKANVVGNDKNIFIPVQSGQRVYLASKEEVSEALGLADIKNPMVCGYLEMYESSGDGNKITLPVNVDSKFLIGPEGAHLNISGISGLAAKTSYAMFLLKAIQDKYLNIEEEDAENDSVAFVGSMSKGVICWLLTSQTILRVKQKRQKR